MDWSEILSLPNLVHAVLGGLLTSITLYMLKSFRTGVLSAPMDRLFDMLPARDRDNTKVSVMASAALPWARRGLAVLQVLLYVVLVASLTGAISVPVSVLVVVQVAILFWLLLWEGRWTRTNLGLIQSWVSEYADLDYSYRVYKTIYNVSARRHDTWVRKISIQAAESIVGIKTIQVGIPQSSRRGTSNLKLSACTDPGRGSVLLFPFRRGKMWLISTMFTQPISQNEERLLIVKGAHPGTWDPLRRKGCDQGTFTLHRPAQSLEIEINLPPGEFEAGIDPVEWPKSESPRTRSRTRYDTDLEGRKQLIWSVTNAPQGQYKYRVSVSRLGVSS